MKLENVVFVLVERVEELHEDVITTLGGTHGMLNRNLLLSAIEAPKASFDGVLFHRSLADMAAAYAFHITRNHPFVDGNKRTALTTALTFLSMQGHRLPRNEGWLDLMLRVANEPAFDRGELVRAFAAQMGFNDPVE